ncbi:MAG: hypothetical protein ACPGUV_04440 [Polyangiales bacterium]
MPPDVEKQARLLRLAAELEAEMHAIGKLAQAVRDLEQGGGDAHSEWMRSLALAFSLERYYTAVESALMRALRAIDGSVPAGERWHLELLNHAHLHVPGLRPALIQPAQADALREILKFRHLARHGYDTEPELRRLAELALQVRDVTPRVIADLQRFCAHLRREAAAPA